MSEHGSGFHVSHSPTQDGRVSVLVYGDIDLATAPGLTEAIKASMTDGVDEVLVDFSEVTFLDSSGVRSLVESYRLADAQGIRLYVHDAQHWVAKVLDVTGVMEMLRMPGLGPEGDGLAASG